MDTEVTMHCSHFKPAVMVVAINSSGKQIAHEYIMCADMRSIEASVRSSDLASMAEK